jgi:hypothetical protein
MSEKELDAYKEGLKKYDIDVEDLDAYKEGLKKDSC